jgi:D-alanyl-D-alanine carboxypeptidase
LPTINGILGTYRGADGLKTGSTCEAGYNLVASAVRDGRRLIGVVLGADSPAIRSAEMTKLLDEGFAVAATGPLAGIEPIELKPSDALPPHQLGAGKCASGAVFALARTRELPSWGIVLGSYPQEFRAQRAIELARPGLNLSAPTVRAVVIPLKGTTFFSAALVGLAERQADDACLLLRSRGSYCMKVTPQTLNNPEALGTAIEEHDFLILLCHKMSICGRKVIHCHRIWLWERANHDFDDLSSGWLRRSGMSTGRSPCGLTAWG